MDQKWIWTLYESKRKIYTNNYEFLDLIWLWMLNIFDVETALNEIEK